MLKACLKSSATSLAFKRLPAFSPSGSGLWAYATRRRTRGALPRADSSQARGVQAAWFTQGHVARANFERERESASYRSGCQPTEQRTMKEFGRSREEREGERVVVVLVNETEDPILIFSPKPSTTYEWWVERVCGLLPFSNISS